MAVLGVLACMAETETGVAKGAPRGGAGEKEGARGTHSSVHVSGRRTTTPPRSMPFLRSLTRGMSARCVYGRCTPLEPLWVGSRASQLRRHTDAIQMFVHI